MGKYSLLIEGEVHGKKEGLNSDEELYILTSKLDYESLDGEYLVGFGVGFIKGQQYRVRLKETKTSMLLQSKVSVLSWVLDESFKGFNLGNFEKSVDSYLDNQDQWGNSKIDHVLFNQLDDLVQNNQWPKACDLLMEYYKTLFKLKAWMDLYQIYSRLQSIRFAKREDKTMDTTEQLRKVQAEFLS